MSILVIAEHNNTEVKSSTLNTISAASKLGDEIEVLVLGSNIENITKEEWQNTIETNLNSHFFFTKFAIPLLKKNKSGSVINLSSTAGLFGFPQRTPYAASKWAIIGLTKSLAMELGKYKICLLYTSPSPRD